MHKLQRNFFVLFFLIAMNLGLLTTLSLVGRTPPLFNNDFSSTNARQYTYRAVDSNDKLHITPHPAAVTSLRYAKNAAGLMVHTPVHNNIKECWTIYFDSTVTATLAINNL